MTHEESVAEAHRLLTEAGSKLVRVSGSHPFWLVQCDWGVSATSDEDHTMDEPHECAAALVAQLGRPSEAEGLVTKWAMSEAEHEVPEPVREEVGGAAEASPSVVDSGDEGAAGGSDGGAEDGAAGGGGSLLADDGSLGEGDSDVILDADYADIAADDREPLGLPAPDDVLIEGGDIDPLLLEAQPEDFAPDEIVADDVAAGVAIFGDNLPMQRLLLIGAVTRHANGLKAVLQEGWTVEEFRELQNLVMRINQGLAPVDEHAQARFLAISESSRAMNAVDAYAEAQVAYLETATREQVEAYKVEEGWP